MADARLREKLNSDSFVLAPGVFDMTSTLMANRVGFDCVYASGFWLTASHMGIPDAGLATYTDMLSRVTQVVELSKAPVIADADTGYGGLLNIAHTVKGYERAGVSGIQIEDQEFPKKCGHTPYRRVVTSDAMVARLSVALDARTDDNMLIIARTDARTGNGLEDAIHRAQLYAEAGADLIFVESLESVEEMAAVSKAVSAPLVANMATGGVTPICTADELKNLGYACTIYPSLLSLVACAAMETSLKHLKLTGDAVDSGLPAFDFGEFCKAIGFEEIWAFEEKWSEALNTP